jgi:hypothetical protein
MFMTATGIRAVTSGCTFLPLLPGFGSTATLPSPTQRDLVFPELIDSSLAALPCKIPPFDVVDPLVIRKDNALCCLLHIDLRSCFLLFLILSRPIFGRRRLCG